MEPRLAWIGLNLVPSITPARRRALLERFGGPAAAWEALKRGEGLALLGEAGPQIREELKDADPERELLLCERTGARILTLEDQGYPPPLREIPEPPPVLYMLGEWQERDRWAVAVVGTRRCTSYGRLVAKQLARELGERGITVVSGLAPGIDTAAHEGALLSGRTMAVLGTGLGRPYPAGSERLFPKISERGAVLSEFPWEMPGSQWSFPRRNRIIAGLALATVVVEAPERSGALITAEFALEQGKEVLAVPGPITSEASRGTNRLIQEGAKPVTSVEDILAELGAPSLLAPSPPPRPTLPEEAQRIVDLLDLEPLSLQEIVDRTGFPQAMVAKILVELELSGLIQEVAGRRYMRTSGRM